MERTARDVGTPLMARDRKDGTGSSLTEDQLEAVWGDILEFEYAVKDACKRNGISYATYSRRCHFDPEVGKRHDTVLEMAAHADSDRSVTVLEDADTSRSADVQRANYLSQALRHRAAMRNRKKYGEKVDLTSGGLGLADILKEAAKLRAPAPVPAISATATVIDEAVVEDAVVE